MATDVDPELLIEAVLLHVEDLGETEGPAWLRTEFDRVLEAVLGGDEFVKATSYQGESHESERMVPAQQLLAVLTQARKRLSAQENGSAASGALLIPRLADFPLN